MILEEGLHFLMIDPEIKNTFSDKPAMFVSAYGPGTLEFSDATNALKDKGIDISEFLLHAAQFVVAFSADCFKVID